MPGEYISEELYDQILAANREHGRTLFTDLSVVEHYSPHVFVKIPQVLPPQVRPRMQSSHLRILRPEDPFVRAEPERVEGIESALHGDRVWYELVRDNIGRLRSIYRYWGERKDNLVPVGSHYHVSSLEYAGLDEGLGRPVMPLGDDISSFDNAFSVMNKELLAYTGDLEEPHSAGLRRPPSELGLQALKAFVEGFRDGALSLNRANIVQRAEQLLDRII